MSFDQHGHRRLAGGGPFDFRAENQKGTGVNNALMMANRYWWGEQNKALGRDCRKVPNCWLPSGHQGGCQPCYERGDLVKVEFADDETGVGEWMWVRVERCDDDNQLVFDVLDGEPINDYGDRLRMGSELAASFSQIKQCR